MNREKKPVSTGVFVALLIIMVVSLLAGCGTTAPVAARFPEPPGKGAMRACADLKKLNDGAKLSDVATTVTDNYALYWECAIKADAWIEWYNIQKNIFEKVSKP